LRLKEEDALFEMEKMETPPVAVLREVGKTSGGVGAHKGKEDWMEGAMRDRVGRAPANGFPPVVSSWSKNWSGEASVVTRKGMMGGPMELVAAA